MKWLRLLHILTASARFGGVVCILSLTYTNFFQLTESEFLTVIPRVPGLYQKVILPFALLTVLQGIIYGLFTNWGFVKYKWILSKWRACASFHLAANHIYGDDDHLIGF